MTCAWTCGRCAGCSLQASPRRPSPSAGGNLLQELDDDWVLEARADLDRDVAAALADLTQRAKAAGDPAAALAWARRRATLCPLDEPAGADLIRALIDAGEPAAALEAFARLQQRLGTELGVPVSAATAALIEPLRTPSNRLPSPPSRSPSAAHWPVLASSLIGRERQFAELAKAWRAARACAGSAVLLEGEGGIGKTRLVEELRAAVRRTSPGGWAIAATAAAGPGSPAPFTIWTDALSDLASVTGQPPDDQAWAADLVRIAPALPGDFPATLVAHMSRVQGLVASARGDTELAERRLAESLAAWQRIARAQDSRQTAVGYVASLIDLGRPPVCSLVEPARELATVAAELSRIRAESSDQHGGHHPEPARQE